MGKPARRGWSALAVLAIAAAAVAAGPVRSTSPQVRLTGAGYGLPMGLDFVNASDGFGLDRIPTSDGGGFALPSLLLSTTDGGQAWTSRTIPAADGQVQAISFTSRTTGWAVSLLSSGGSPQVPLILHTTDGGKSWSTETEPSGASHLSGVDFLNAHDGWVAGETVGGAPSVAATTDGGAVWTLQAVPAPSGFGELSTIAFSNAHDGWAAGEVNNDPILVATTDGGAIWIGQTLPAGVTVGASGRRRPSPSGSRRSRWRFPTASMAGCSVTP